MAEKMITSKAKDVAPIEYVPFDPENANLSKAQFIAKRRRQKEIKLRLAEAKKKIEAEIENEVPTGPAKENIAEEIKAEQPIAVKKVEKRGRPRLKPKEIL